MRVPADSSPATSVATVSFDIARIPSMWSELAN
jgi:hypothetical protein